jgi:hypothetical protein
LAARSQSPGQLRVIAPRVFHFNRHATASRVFDLKYHSIQQTFAAKVFDLDHHTIEQATAPKLAHLNRHDLTPRIFHLNHHVTSGSLLHLNDFQRTEIRMRLSGERGLPNIAHFV